MTLIICGACATRFTSIEAKAAHRVAGRCLTFGEMKAAGLFRLGNGFVSDKKPKKSMNRRPYGRYSTRRADRGPIYPP